MKIKRQKLNIIVLGVMVVLSIVIGCKKEEGKVLAKVNKTTITEEEFYSLIPAQYAGMLGPGQKKELLRKWIDNELIYQEALKSKIHKEKEIRVKLQQIEREVLANEFINRFIDKIGSVDESAVKSYFDSHKEEYNTERKIAQILLSDKSQVPEVTSRLNGGEDFATIAKEYSIDPSGGRGGEVGYIRRGDIPQLPDIEEAIFSLKNIGDISGAIETLNGYYIIKLLDIRKLSTEVGYDSVKEKIKGFLELSKRKRAFDELLAGLRDKQKIEAHYEMLE